MKSLAYLAWFASACALALAQPNTPAPAATPSEWRIPGTESFVMRSSVVQRDYEIMVALPHKYSESSGVPYEWLTWCALWSS